MFLISCTTDITTITTTNQTTEENTTALTTTESQTTTENTTSEIVTTQEEELGTFLGVENVEVIKGHYFNSLDGVSIDTSLGKDISEYIHVNGSVDYGTAGIYELTYSVEYNGDEVTATRQIEVVDGIYVEEQGSRPTITSGPVALGVGGYFTGLLTSIEHPVIPGHIESKLKDIAIPSTGWWTTLLVENYGGSNGIYTNPLRTAFYNEGLEITNPLDGFVQYWNVNGDQTIAQFPIAIKDLFLKSSDLAANYTTQVIDYTDNSVKVAMRNNGSKEDELVISLVQGSPYVFAETKNKSAITISMEQGANVEFYDLLGNQILDNSHTGDGLVIKYVQRHSGYNCSPPSNVISPQYTDKFYLVNAPTDTVFNISNNILSLHMVEGNYVSIAGINDLSETEFYHNHGYELINDLSAKYEVNHKDSLVYTDYVASTQSLRSDIDEKSILALMPHHYKYSNALTTDYTYRTVRGTLKLMEGNYFQTILSFNGLLPGYTLPENEEFSRSNMVTYLELLDSETSYSDTENFFNAEGPYWNSKALYPLAQGIIIADQIGDEELKLSFVGKLRYLLSDWYTYSGSSDEKFLYYNNDWGTVYYSNNDFGTATGLSDHSFTHGYLIYASAVLAMYDSSFVDEYGLMVDLLLDDYMYEDRESANFEYLRNFDSWAGHSWAHGFGNFAEGNNLESTSEALNSWNAGYLWALASKDQVRMDAAIYGFVTEFSAIKQYWFDYEDENWDPAFGDYVDVAGMVWGGKHDYATWFGANPTFIYGIQWLPTGEYLTNYALSDTDYDKLSSIFSTYLAAKNGVIDTWYSNMWAIQAIVDPIIAMQIFDENMIINDDYPAELPGTYWMINALATLGRRTDEVWMEVKLGVASTIYEDQEGNLVSMIWNVSDEAQEVVFYDTNGVKNTFIVESNSFTKVILN
jgi:endoglucanase Acf2